GPEATVTPPAAPAPLLALQKHLALGTGPPLPAPADDPNHCTGPEATVTPPAAPAPLLALQKHLALGTGPPLPAAAAATPNHCSGSEPTVTPPAVPLHIFAPRVQTALDAGPPMSDDDGALGPAPADLVHEKRPAAAVNKQSPVRPYNGRRIVHLPHQCCTVPAALAAGGYLSTDYYHSRHRP
ncbi:hypothetical protein Vretifemale_17073, partial [Volvox reticuliferus]